VGPKARTLPFAMCCR